MPKSTKRTKRTTKPKPATVQAAAPVTKPKPAEKPDRLATRIAVFAGYRGDADPDRPSVPIKPVSSYKADRLYAGAAVNITSRAARAVRYLAKRANVSIEAGARIPRYVHDTAGVPCVLENGCGRDAIGSGLLTLPESDPGLSTDTLLTLTKRGFEYMRDNKLVS